MQSIYNVARIAARQIEPAYLLVNRIAPMLDLEGWRASCWEVLRDKGPRCGQDDIIVATNPLGYVQGLCVTAVRRHIVYGRMLDVSILAVASAADEAGVMSDLLLHLKALAGAEACDGIRIWAAGKNAEGPCFIVHRVNSFDHGTLITLDQSSLRDG